MRFRFYDSASYPTARRNIPRADRRTSVRANVAYRVPMERVLLEHARTLAARESGLAVVVVLRADGSPSASVVNATVIEHPLSGDQVVAFVTRGDARKLQRLRVQRSATIVFRSEWEWVAIEGRAELAGPNDPLPPLTHDDISRLRSGIYAAAVGGSDDEWARLDATMDAEHHTVVLVRPTRVYSNAPG